MQEEGLSPRVRGNLIYGSDPLVLPGSIPACAGEPPWSRETVFCCWVYPRVCGGTPMAAEINDLMPGLSPRVRGNLCSRLTPLRYYGSIPACAGEPTYLLTGHVLMGVYPRVCGGTSVTA